MSNGLVTKKDGNDISSYLTPFITSLSNGVNFQIKRGWGRNFMQRVLTLVSSRPCLHGANREAICGLIYRIVYIH